VAAKGCAGAKLRERFWEDGALLKRELEAHGWSNRNVAEEHGTTEFTIRKWRSPKKHNLGGPNVRNGRDRSGVVEPGEPVSEVEMLRTRLAEYEKHLRSYRTGDVQTELIVERITSAVRVAAPRYRPPAAAKAGKLEPQEAFLQLGDFHGSEVVKPEEVLGMNAYNWDVMLERMAEVQRAARSHIKHAGFPVPKLHVGLLGDMSSGDIHAELAITNDRPAAAAVVDLAYELAAMIAGFVPDVPLIEVHGVPGNHPRATQKPSAKEYYNNGDWLLYKLVESILSKHPSITFNFPRSAYCRAVVADRWHVLMTHGDGIKSTMPGVPWGGISRRVTAINEQMAAAEIAVDYIMIGHFHTANALDGVLTETLMNGSLKGVDEYSLKQFGGGRRAKQRLLFFHEKRGLTGAHWIDLQGIVPAVERRAR